MNMICRVICAFAGLSMFLSAAGAVAAPMANLFYAMDMAFAPPYRHPAMTRAQLFDLVKELGYNGVGWTEKAPQEVKSVLAELQTRGLKMYAIYFQGKVTPEGDLTYSSNLLPTMDVLKGHNVILWLHIGGKGPVIGTLRGDEPVVRKLRELAESAHANGLKIALYPHLGEWTERFGDATRLANRLPGLRHPRPAARDPRPHDRRLAKAVGWKPVEVMQMQYM